MLRRMGLYMCCVLIHEASKGLWLEHGHYKEDPAQASRMNRVVWAVLFCSDCAPLDSDTSVLEVTSSSAHADMEGGTHVQLGIGEALIEQPRYGAYI